MTSTLNAFNTNQQPDRQLFSTTFMVCFVVIALAIMIILYPRKMLLKMAISQQDPQAITLYYVKQLSQLYPKNNDLKIALIKQQIGNREWHDAKQELLGLSREHDPALLIQAQWLQYRLSFAYAYHLLPTDPKRESKLQRAKDEAIRLMSLSLTLSELEQLGSDLLGFSLQKESLKVYLRVASLKPTINVNFLLYIAKVALYAGDHLVAGNYYFMAVNKVTDIKLKREYILSGLKAYQGGSLLNEGLIAVNKISQEITNDDAMLNFLVNYALTADRADLAQEYIERLLVLPTPEAIN